MARAVTSAAAAQILTKLTSLPVRAVAREKMVSPSIWVWTGRMVRARPSWDTSARRQHYSLVSLQSTATTPMVVLLPAGIRA